ncbi:MAG TPA: glycosyltransferase, partial [Coriobacteriia bacterium]
MPLPDRPMRVTMVNKYYWPPHLGGVETVVRNLSEGLVAETGASVRAIVCNEGPERVEEMIAGVDVVRLSRQFALSSAPIALSMPAVLAAETRRPSPPDLINLHFPYPWGELSWLRAHPDVPMVLSYHSDIVRQKRMLAAYRPFLEAALDRADVITTSSPNLRDGSPFLAPHADKVRIVDYGLHVEQIAEPPASVLACAEQIRAEHAGRKIVLFVGRLVYYKGADVLLRAMA